MEHKATDVIFVYANFFFCHLPVSRDALPLPAIMPAMSKNGQWCQLALPSLLKLLKSSNQRKQNFWLHKANSQSSLTAPEKAKLWVLLKEMANTSFQKGMWKIKKNGILSQNFLNIFFTVFASKKMIKKYLKMNCIEIQPKH